MTKEQIKNFLLGNPGYLKCGDVRIANRLNIDLDEARIAKQEVKEYIKADNPVEGIPMPKILFLDIETSPMKAFVWGMWKQNISLDAIEADWFMISWAAKWLNGKTITRVITPEEALAETDESIIQELWDVLEEADIVVTHNGDKFDLKKINSRFIEHGLGPVSPFKSVDTLKVARKSFGFTSNKLEALARKFGFEGKHDTSFKLWVDCLNGNMDALVRMSKYNTQDILILEKIYFKLLPWIKNHPNMGLYLLDNRTKCTNCGSSDLTEIKPALSSIGIYQAYRCKKCGTISKDRKSLLSREENKHILTNYK